MRTQSSTRFLVSAFVTSLLGLTARASAQPGIGNQLPPPSQRAIAIFGYVKTGEGDPVSGVELKVTAPQYPGRGVTLTTDGNGLYHTYVPAGSYDVVADKDGYTFDPATGTTTVPTTGEAHSPYGEVDFKAIPADDTTPTATKFGPFGYIKTPGGEPISGVTVTVTPDGGGAAVTCTTAGNGLYHVHVPAGTYQVVPQKTGYTFTPAGGNVTLPTTGEKTSPYAELDFTGTSNTAGGGTTTNPEHGYGIYGHVKTAAGEPVSGVQVAVTPAAGGTPVLLTSNAQGLFYTHVPAGTYTLVPSANGLTFTPASGTVAVPTSQSNSTYAQVNFTASGTTGEKEPGLYGYVKDADGKPIGGVSLRVTGGTDTVTLTSSSQGLYYTHLPPGTYTIVPYKDGWSFAPATGSVTLPTTGQPHSPYGEVDFTGQTAAN